MSEDELESCMMLTLAKEVGDNALAELGWLDCREGQAIGPTAAPNAGRREAAHGAASFLFPYVFLHDTYVLITNTVLSSSTMACARAFPALRLAATTLFRESTAQGSRNRRTTHHVPSLIA